MHRFVLSLIFPAATLSGCSVHHDEGSDTSIISAAEAIISNDLNDPQSAQFRNETLSSDRSIVCGEVNYKNKFGGFEGFTNFIVNSKAKTHGIYHADEKYGIDMSAAMSWPIPCLPESMKKIVISMRKEMKSEEKGGSEHRDRSETSDAN